MAICHVPWYTFSKVSKPRWHQHGIFFRNTISDLKSSVSQIKIITHKSEIRRLLLPHLIINKLKPVGTLTPPPPKKKKKKKKKSNCKIPFSVFPPPGENFSEKIQKFEYSTSSSGKLNYNKNVIWEFDNVTLRAFPIRGVSYSEAGINTFRNI